MAKKVKRFKLKAGIHTNHEGQTFKASPLGAPGYGTVVEDTRDLVAMFGPGKFEPVPDFVPASSTNTNPVSAPPPRDDDEELAPANPAAAATPGETAASHVAVASKLGADVTEKFPKALEGGLLVFSNEAKGAKLRFFVAEPELPEDALNDNKDLKSGKAVEGFVSEFLGGK